jgi:hypothetical protein
MDLLYFDESGDDGLKMGSSRFLALTSVRLPVSDWNHCNSGIQELRKELARELGIPTGCELHTKDLLLRKGHFAQLGLTRGDVLRAVDLINATATNIAISVKSIVIDKRPGSNPLRIALLSHLNSQTAPCIAISDRGRVPRMKQLVRTAYFEGALSHQPPESMLEIESRECHLVQLADYFATAAYFRACDEIGFPLHARMNPEEATALSRTIEGLNRTYDLVQP